MPLLRARLHHRGDGAAACAHRRLAAAQPLCPVEGVLPEDWTERYNTAPVLIETFVETPRYTGAVYKASGWLRVGTTQGRGRYDRDKLYDKPKKVSHPPIPARPNGYLQ